MIVTLRNILYVIVGIAFGTISWIADPVPDIPVLSEIGQLVIELLGYTALLDSEAPKKIGLVFILVVALIALIIVVEVGLAIYRRIRLPSFEHLYEQVSNRLLRYLNDRGDEARRLRETTDENANDGEVSGQRSIEEGRLVQGLLRDIRKSLLDGYSEKGVLTGTIMLVAQESGQSEKRLFVEFWSNDTNHEPETWRMRTGFKRGEGYCGKAWMTGQVIVGTKRKWMGLLPDPQHVPTSQRQKKVRSFFCVPYVHVRRLDPAVGAVDPTLFVLNLDSTAGSYFPRGRVAQERLVKVLNPLILLLSNHARNYVEANNEVLA